MNCNQIGVYFRDVHCSFEDVRVYLGHTVHSMGTHDAQVGHVEPLLSTFLNERHTAQTIMITRILSGNFLQNKNNKRQEMSYLRLIIIDIKVWPVSKAIL